MGTPFPRQVGPGALTHEETAAATSMAAAPAPAAFGDGAFGDDQERAQLIELITAALEQQEALAAHNAAVQARLAQYFLVRQVRCGGLLR